MTVDSGSLPFLVVHGGWFWIVAVVLSAAALVGVLVLMRRMFAALYVRAVIASLRKAVADVLDEGAIVVAGRWRETYIDVGTDRVLVDSGAQRGFKIATGDDVIATGLLARLPAAEQPGGYRDGGETWRLDNAEIYAATPRVRPLRWRGHMVCAVIALLSSYLTLRYVGGKLAERVQSHDYLPSDGSPLALGDLDAVSIAAALPGSRAKALEHLEWGLKRHPYRDERSVGRRLALAQLLHGSCGGLGLLEPAGRYDEELANARRCGAHRDVFEVEFARGDYAASWANRPPGLDWPFREGVLAIVTSDWVAAADAAERAAKLYERDASRDVDNDELRRSISRDFAQKFRCMAQWFLFLGKDAAASERLRKLATDRSYHPLVCAPIYALTLAAEQRKQALLDALAVADEPGKHTSQAFTSRMLLWLDGEDADGARYTSYDVARGVAEGGNVDPRAWLLRFGVERWRGQDVRNLVIALGGVALFEVQRGDLAAARRAADEALAATRDLGDAVAEERARELNTIVTFRAGAVELPPRGHVDSLLDSLRVRRGEPPQHGVSAYPESCEPRLATAVADAQRGDGRPLARVMQSCSLYATSAPAVLVGLLPLIKEGRSELATALRWWDEGGHEAVSEPFSWAAYVALRRDLARLVGDQESADRWAGIAKRVVAPFDDRTRTLAMLFWKHL